MSDKKRDDMAHKKPERHDEYMQAFERMCNYGTTSEEVKSWCKEVNQHELEEFEKQLEPFHGKIITLH